MSTTARALDNPKIRDCDGFFIASNPKYGALSSLTKSELVSFHLYCASPDDATPMIKYFIDSGFDPDSAKEEVQILCNRWQSDGWLRTDFPREDPSPLAVVYFTVTRFCDLACPYCYQGLNNRRGTDMTVEQARITLDKIAEFNPQCNITVTGGEPFTHPNILEILDLIDERKLPFTILSNGTHISPEVAARLKSYSTFRFIQVSLDGFSEETFALTRGKKAFPKVMEAIESIIKEDVPFVLAPTMHEKNVHELYDISAYAIEHGGWVSPNNLRHLPQDSNKRYYDENGDSVPLSKVSKEGSDSYAEILHRLTLSNDTLLNYIAISGRRLKNQFGEERITELSTKFGGRSVCSVDEPNSHFICGMGHSLMDINWNGDVYPCHMLKADELILGNIFECDFNDILATVAAKNIRVKSYEIDKCSGCDFNSTCGSGCRAGSYFEYGSFAREDNLCDVNNRGSMRRMFTEAMARDPSLKDKADEFFTKYRDVSKDIMSSVTPPKIEKEDVIEIFTP